MSETSDKIKGYVYVLEVKDIDLPVCKIGMTSRNPHDRCTEINNSSTGDFIWDVAHYISVDDCKKLESLFHKKLEPLRQKKREFFNINADDAYTALLSILKNQAEVKEISLEEVDSETIIKEVTSKKSKSKPPYKKIYPQYTELLQSFASILGVKGRPFGQLNKPYFGMSDGNEGVQWIVGIRTDAEKVWFGINLEGKKYSNWPIATFILSELKSNSIESLKANNLNNVILRFMRDAWQGLSRPDILEHYFGGKEFSLPKINSQLWTTILKEALGCLNERKCYRGRNKQAVTLANKQKEGEQIRNMEVSPHLTIWTQIDLSDDITSNLAFEIDRLKPVYEWVTRVSQA